MFSLIIFIYSLNSLLDLFCNLERGAHSLTVKCKRLPASTIGIEFPFVFPLVFPFFALFCYFPPILYCLFFYIISIHINVCVCVFFQSLSIVFCNKLWFFVTFSILSISIFLFPCFSMIFHLWFSSMLFYYFINFLCFLVVCFFFVKVHLHWFFLYQFLLNKCNNLFIFF